MPDKIVDTENTTAPKETPPVEVKEKQGDVEKKKETKKEGGDESLMGTLLIVSLVICLLAATGYFGYAGYRLYRTAKAEQSIPSIDGLAVQEVSAPAATEPTSEAPKAEEKPPETPAIDKAKANIKVLNGGAAKGSASTYMETLKKAGYSAAVFGNSFGSYKGVTLYYATGKEKEAEAIKQDIVTTYPAVTVKAAPQGDKDAAAATFVVILGQ